MKISIIIPVYNEESHLKDVFNNLHKVEFPCSVEYIIVDDASSDNSYKIIQEIANEVSTVKFHKQTENQGKGAAIHKGIELATGNFICVQDADFEYDPKDLVRLAKPLIDNEADVVYGSRFHTSNKQVHRTFHYLVNRFLTLFSNIFSGVYLSDMETCYKLFRSEIIKSMDLESKRFGFEPEITAKIAKLNIRIQEHPISYYPRNYDEGKKINWKDGVAAIWFILKYNFKGMPERTAKLLPAHMVPGGRIWL